MTNYDISKTVLFRQYPSDNVIIVAIVSWLWP